ncbi:hypothetical protein PsorP6_017497 [Peronosclerospora sorghi]|uniref:Uncharacterized protein n=1 Tax=Peronosclerospora sorghi TaxID=230839 RepID=A0ACC0WNY3_9STRA|nr:hypothetical protein PsorP6_017497 [Peronosclerospora sorghi]
MSTAIKGVVRLRVLAGKASPSPAIGQALGPLGVNMMEFCKAFNERTAKFTENIPVPVVLTAFTDRTFTFTTKTPPATWFLKKAAGISSGSATPGQHVVGSVHLRQIYEIAKVKQQDELLEYLELKAICKSLIGSAKSMGLELKSSKCIVVMPEPVDDSKALTTGESATSCCLKMLGTYCKLAWSVALLVRVRLLCNSVVMGLNGGSKSRFKSASQCTPANHGCPIISNAPSAPQPMRSCGFLINNRFRKSVAVWEKCSGGYKGSLLKIF